MNKEKPHLQDYIRILLKRRWIVILTFSVLTLTVFYDTMKMTTIYEAPCTIQIEQAHPSSTLLNELMALTSDLRTESFIDSEKEILKSRTIAEKVVKNLKLDRQLYLNNTKLYNPHHLNQLTQLLDNLNQPSDLRPQTPDLGPQTSDLRPQTSDFRPQTSDLGLRTSDLGLKIKFLDDAGNFEITDSNGKLLTPDPSPLTPDPLQIKPRKGDEIKVIRMRFNKAVEALQGRVNIEPLARQTNLIKIAVQGENPEEIKDIANEIARVYIEQNIARRSQQASQLLDFIQAQLEDVHHGLQRAEEDLDKYKSKEGMVLPREEIMTLIGDLSEFEVEKAKLGLEKKQAERLLEALTNREAIDKNFILSSLNITDPIVTKLVSDLSRLEVEKRSLLTSFTETNPLVRNISTQIEEVRQKILQSVKNTIRALSQREEALSKVIGRMEKGIKGLPVRERRLAVLERAAKVNEKVFLYLLEKQQEARIIKASTVGNVQVIDPAIIAEKPIKPRAKLNMLLAIISGLTLGIGLAFFMEYLDRSIHSTDEVERKTNLPVFGTILYVKEDRAKQLPVAPEKALITLREPKSPGSEVYRSLRTNIQFADLEKKLKTILIASPGPQEGKSTIVANLAVTMARLGSRTLVVDTDLRKPMLHHLFGEPREPGITNILREEEEWKEALRVTHTENLHLITAGTLPPNPSELLDCRRMRELIAELKEAYDVILFDSPPLMAVTDGAVIGTKVDGVFLVGRTGNTTSDQLIKAKTLMENVHARVMGVIINGIQPEFDGYGYYYYHQYYYGEKKEKRRRQVSYAKQLRRQLRNFKDSISRKL